MLTLEAIPARWLAGGQQLLRFGSIDWRVAFGFPEMIARVFHAALQIGRAHV